MSSITDSTLLVNRAVIGLIFAIVIAMTLVFALLGGFTLLELFIYTKLGWEYRKILGLITLFGLVCSSILAVIALGSSYVSIFIGLLSLYRIFNVYRVVFGLVSPARLRNNAFTTSVRLAFVTFLILVLANSFEAHLHTESLFVIISCALLGLSLLILQALRLSLGRMDLPQLESNHASRDLPSITVAIPARNETEDLQDCLTSLIATTYPKIEILTLDDCSQNRRTPEIIRHFAHEGVRFLHGAIPPDPWLAKNYAYEQLMKEANGDYILFCGVDARFEPKTLHRLVEGIVQSDKDMISLMPINHVSQGHILPYLIQPIRYAWELALPRRWSKRPPVLSTTWIASKQFLKDSGGFGAVRQAILPERYFARQALRSKKYGFYRSGHDVGLSSVKSGPEQLDTALRTRYPVAQRSPEYVLALSLVEISLAVFPILFVVYGYMQQNGTLLITGGLTILVLSVIYGVIDRLTYQSWKFVSFVSMPFALVFDAVVLHISMFKYEFSEVLWKGRNICLPLLQAIPEMPKMRPRR